MAFGAQKINPLDTRPGRGIGVSLPFNAPSVFYSTYTTKDAIKNNLINFFLTNKNERYLSPNFGGNLRAFLFQQISSGNVEFLKTNIETQLTDYFPSINVASLEVLENPEFNEVTVNLKYNIKDTGVSDEVQISFT